MFMLSAYFFIIYIVFLWAGTHVYTVVAEDPDTVGSLTYQITGNITINHLDLTFLHVDR